MKFVTQADVKGAEVQKYAAIVMFSTEVWGTRELGTCSSRHQSGGQRHQRRWYRRGGVFSMGRGGGISY